MRILTNDLLLGEPAAHARYPETADEWAAWDALWQAYGWPETPRTLSARATLAYAIAVARRGRADALIGVVSPGTIKRALEITGAVDGAGDVEWPRPRGIPTADEVSTWPRGLPG